MENLHDLFEVTVKLTYNAEKRFLRLMPKLLKAASNDKLRETIKVQIERTQLYLKRLEQVAKQGGFRPTGKVCKSAKCLVEEADLQLTGQTHGATLDAAIIVSAQRNEHYGICAYGTLLAWSIELGNPDITELLEESLKDHGYADEAYSKIARRINTSANSLISATA